MVARLAEYLGKSDPVSNRFRNERNVPELKERMQAAQGLQPMLQAKTQLAVELIRNNQNEEAVQQLDEIDATVRTRNLELPENLLTYLKFQRALAFLRIGERANCLTNHNSESCLVPISGAGVHKLQSGSRSAIEVLEQVLKSSPKDLGARWILNIAYQTVGEYPNGVPSAYLIPPTIFESEYSLQKFPDVAASAGLDIENPAGGVITEDFDGDGDLDILMTSWWVDGQMRYFRNRGDGTFEERTREAGLMGLTGGLNLIQTDYNNDGKIDVLVLRGAWMATGGHMPKSLLRNNGDGTFEDVTESAGLLSLHPTQTAVWFDYDNDGWLDLFVGNESTANDPNLCELFHNNHNGTFTECAASSGTAIQAFVKGVVSGDFNNDGRPDLYLSCLNGDNYLLMNQGGSSPTEWKFSNTAKQAGVTDPQNSFPAFVFDYDNDGWQDIFVSGYSIRSVADVAANSLGLNSGGERCRLYRNNGDGTFSDVSIAAGVFKVIHSMGINFGDLDNDGWLDFYCGTGDPDFQTLIPNKMFRNAGGKFFQDVTTAGGFGNIQKGHAVAFADLDNDGDQDIFAMIGGAYRGDIYRDSLFLNPGTPTNHFVNLRLEGRSSNRAALGARLKISVGVPGGERSIYSVVSSGGSFGASSFRRELGLGNAIGIKSLEITWPTTGKVQVISGLQLDRFYRVVEGEPSAELLQVPHFQFATGKAAGGHNAPHVHGASGGAALAP